jgi:lactobin A/cerein 7B family class IIb bacteriocin
MASIIVDDLPNYNVSGSDLFNDSESFMQELTEDELVETNGGITPLIIPVLVFSVSAALTITVTHEITRR